MDKKKMIEMARKIDKVEKVKFMDLRPLTTFIPPSFLWAMHILTPYGWVGINETLDGNETLEDMLKMRKELGFRYFETFYILVRDERVHPSVNE